MELNPIKATSYRDLLKHFQQAETPPSVLTQRENKVVHRPLHLKKSHPTRGNKENITKHHIQSVHQKSVSHKSEWAEQDALKQLSQRRKDRQLQLSYNKFITYITSLLTSLTGTAPPELLTNRLAYLQYLAALKQMSFIKETYEPSPNDTVSDLWNELASHSHSIGAFILFLASILNMRRPDDQNASKYVYLAKKYADLRFTRMEMLGKTKTVQDQEEFPFTPVISQRSRTLAASRSKSKGRTDRCIAQKSYHQFLEESSESQPQNILNQITDSLAGNRRSQILYKMAKDKSVQKRRDKKSSEVQYEKSIKQLTFHPKIHPNSVKQKHKKTIHGEQDSVNRMIRGRIQRQVRRVIQEKGLPYNQKLFQKMKRQKYEAMQRLRNSEHPQPFPPQQQSPQSQNNPISLPSTNSIPQPKKATKVQPIVLTIQVDEDRCEKLVIDDPSRYKQVAAKFIKDFNLRPEMYDKLIEGVQKALKFQLTQVDEDSCESEYESLE